MGAAAVPGVCHLACWGGRGRVLSLAESWRSSSHQQEAITVSLSLKVAGVPSQVAPRRGGEHPGDMDQGQGDT